ncbi:MAG: alpha-D-ribose 1-methylphosphonate 5-triphosphate diphosphatase, partial [Pseudomonadota bacterium]
RPRSLTHTDALIRAVHAVRDTARVDHRIHARFDITNTEAIASLEGLLADGLIDLVSVMDHTPGQGQYRDIERHIAQRAANRGIPLEEARATVRADIDAATPETDVLDNLRTVSALCEQHGIPLASHDDDTVEKTAFIAQLGAVISEFPVTREAAEAAVAQGLMTAMGAPNAMRGESYSGNLSARATHDAGLLHILASDYHPHAILPAIRALASTDPGGVAGAVQLATANPARAVGLDDRGRLAIGARADLVLVDSRDRVVMTLRGGEVIYTDGSVDPHHIDVSR